MHRLIIEYAFFKRCLKRSNRLVYSRVSKKICVNSRTIYCWLLKSLSLSLIWPEESFYFKDVVSHSAINTEPQKYMRTDYRQHLKQTTAGSCNVEWVPLRVVKWFPCSASLELLSYFQRNTRHACTTSENKKTQKCVKECLHSGEDVKHTV